MSVLTKEQLDKAKTVLALGMSAELYANVTREDLLDTIADLQAQLARANETADAKVFSAIHQAIQYAETASSNPRRIGISPNQAAEMIDSINAIAPADASRALAEQIRKAKLEELENLLAITQEPISQAEKVAKVAQRRAELSREP